MKKFANWVGLLVLLLAFSVAAENLALNKKYAVNIGPEATYADNGTELTNGKNAQPSIYDAGWAGYLRQDYRIFVVDLEAAYMIDSISISALQDIGTGVHLPYWACFSISTDGQRWRSVDTQEFDESEMPEGITSKEYVAQLKSIKARYAAVKLPVGTWLFVDEITVNGDPSTKEVVEVRYMIDEVDFEEIEFDY